MTSLGWTIVGAGIVAMVVRLAMWARDRRRAAGLRNAERLGQAVAAFLATNSRAWASEDAMIAAIVAGADDVALRDFGAAADRARAAANTAFHRLEEARTSAGLRNRPLPPQLLPAGRDTDRLTTDPSGA